MRRVGVSHHDVPHVISACSFFAHPYEQQRHPEGNIGVGMWVGAGGRNLIF